MRVRDWSGSSVSSAYRYIKPYRRQLSGFSLLELMVSVGIMSVTLLLVLAVFTGSMKASQKTTDLTAGVIVAETVLTKDVYNIVNKVSGEADVGAYDKLVGGGGVVASGIKNLNNTTFVWELTSNKVVDSGTGSVSSGSEVAKNDLVKLDVVIWWGKSGDQVTEYSSASGDMKAEGAKNTTTLSTTNAGILRCEMSRLFNVSSDF
ncbi:MAG: prepilin-type N-terminal cleavage/methylation domain-containing protein [Candidatus Bruticola sp.]